MPDVEQAESTKSQPLDVSLKDIGPARKSLTIKVPPERIAEKIESNFSQLNTSAVVPGFRKGRVPRKLLEKRFGKTLQEDARNQLLSECYSQAVEDNKLDVIGEPDIKDMDEIKLPESGPLEFSVEVEVSPQVKLPDLKGIKVNKPKMAVSDSNVDEEINRLRERFGKPSEATDAAVQEKDYVKADVKILPGKDAADDAEPISHHPESWIMAHGKDQDYKGHVAGIVVEQLGKKLIGKKSGHTAKISMTGPSGHENEKIKDQPITIVIAIQSVDRVEPASEQEVVEMWGLESVEKLRERLTELLKERQERQQQVAMHQQLSDYLMDKVDLELPQGLTSRQSARTLHRRAMEMAYAGVDTQEIEQKIAEMRQESEADAVKQLKQFFIMDQAAKDLNVEVTEGEVNGRIAMMATQQGRRPEKVRHDMQRKGEIEHLFLQIREQKTLDKILESAAISEVDEVGDTEKKKPKKTTKKKSAAKPKKKTKKE